VISVATDQRLRDDAEANARQVRNQLDASGVSANVEVKVGQPDQTLVNTAKELASDLIVMGRHGRSGLERLLLGSVSERVIGHATCPVLVVTA
jgi:nucleotide-binding universal stress UspA family protein